MNTETMTIDLTPTYAEGARICAYWLGNQAGKSPEIFLNGTYWTESRLHQEDAVVTYNKVQTAIDALEAVGVDFYKQSQTFKTRLIMGARDKALARHHA
jgi:hypothetical protein